jgi:hypothetical protein
MRVKQISVFLENKSGRLARVTEILEENSINIRALSIADTTDFGILRLIVNNPDKAKDILKENDFTVSATEVIAVQVDDKPGGLGKVLKYLDDSGVNIEYLYAFIEKNASDALVVFRVEQIDEAIKVLGEKGITILKGKDVYQL